jgi:hypothetical protein
MTQLALALDVPAKEVVVRVAHRGARKAARKAGEEAATRCAAKADQRNPGFTFMARDFVLRYLTAHGRSAGEDIVDAATQSGIRAHDARAWGSVFGRLSGKHIRCTRSDLVRRKGHGTSGGKEWELVR